MNSEFVLSQAGRLALRVRDPAPSGSASDRLMAQSARAWMLVYQRPITSEEASWVSEFMARCPGQPGPERDLAVMTNLCQQLLISNEFLYVD
jgi:hypothetical protein